MEVRTKSKELRVTNPTVAPPPPVKWNHIPSKDGDLIMMGCDVAVDSDSMVIVTGRLTPRGMEIKEIIDKIRK